MDEVKRNYRWLYGPEVLDALRGSDILDMRYAKRASIDISSDEFVTISVDFPISTEQWEQIATKLPWNDARD